MSDLGYKDTIDSFLDWNSPIFEKHAEALAPQVIPYEASPCNYQTESGQPGSSRPTCGLSALNYVRLALKLEAEGFADVELLRRVISQLMIDDAMTIVNDLRPDRYMNVEELLEVPIFQEAVTTTATLRRVPENDGLRKIFSAWFPHTSTHVQAAVFSKSQEIIVCLRIPVFESAVYALLDSHPRSNHPQGPALTLTNQLDEILSCLSHILPRERNDVALDDTDPDHLFSAHRLSARANAHKLEVKDMLARSIAYLSTRSTSLASDHIALLRARAEHFRKMHHKPDPSTLKLKADTQTTASSSSSDSRRGLNSSTSTQHRGEFGWQLSLLLNPEQVLMNDPTVHEDQNKQDHGLPSHIPSLGIDNKENIPPVAESSSKSYNNRRTASVHQMEDVEGGKGEDAMPDDEEKPTVPAKDSLGSDAGPSPFHRSDFGWQMVLQQEMERNIKLGNMPVNSSPHQATKLSSLEAKMATVPQEDSTRNISAESELAWQAALAQQLQEEEEISALIQHHGSGDHAWLVALHKRLQEEENANMQAPGSSSLTRSEIDWQLAVQLQQEEVNRGTAFVTEDGDTTAGTSTFTTLNIPPASDSFECGICCELHDVTEKLSLSDCGHVFCKECLTTFTKTKIQDGRYPIFCPECLAERPRANKSQVTEDIIQQLDIPQEQLNRLAELQLLAHSITLQCPRCKETMNIDREQFGEEHVLVCPLPRCGHKWCKSCLKTLASSEEHHRCKNGNIERLMKRKGWKYCPGCRTPVQKEAGCNHMTCGTPGCNVHFCYKCGVLMIDTTNGGDVGTAVTEHYMNCRLFEKRWKCSIQ
ncbi:hypothetical protein BDZ97DRAFT_1802901 [Flammula alnicola]|nr:hypothetical protein BDZ97DRAFT_1802901 [Flammula alnicola]